MNWHNWEDYAAGLYAATLNTARIDASAKLLNDPERFKDAAQEMLREWPTAATHNQRHLWSGRNAWLGQATCCYAHGATATETRAAWGLLTNAAQAAANAIAALVRTEWEREVTHHAQTLPGM